MKRLIVIVFAITLSGALAVPGFAEITPGKGSVSLFFGEYSFDHDMPIKDNQVYGLRLGYDITERWGAEGVFDYVATKPKNAAGDVKAYGLRLDALYHFRYAEKLVPFLAAGVGGSMIDYAWGMNEDPNDFLFNYGGGVKYFLSEDWALRADVRHLLVFDGGRQDWEYTIGITYLFGGSRAAPAADKDSDNDGVMDSLDKCPDTPRGVKVGADGCPLDSDGDGVPDYLDKCPDTPKGVKVGADGCPLDSDGDGVPDYLDKCPDTPKGAMVDADGCPLDSDRDGVPDYLDKCPNTPKGVKVGADGCPLDSDGDGVPDYLDKCPDTPKGVKVDKNGCPIPGKVAEKAPEKVSIALKIEFDSGKAVIKPQYEDQIKKVADFMTTYPETSAVIEGHTDNVGKEASNISLSTRRAESVRTYLIEKFGIAPGRLSAKGFGSSQPVADNATSDGRQKNRRINAVLETMKK